ncbi:tyrosine-type recombinase/integrase [Microvirga vignae]|uniref:tyrosine-type recombinase/integrase n=1 Tax=Microvirga vignae TaxID=1225564 RepID=UPI00244ECDE2|nr:tyrosine-type recombinase/integrase [Microvirga vignae]
MRRGELPSIRWKDVDPTALTIRILKTKNGHPRTIPLIPKAVEMLSHWRGRMSGSFRLHPMPCGWLGRPEAT